MSESIPGLPHWKRDHVNGGARRDDGLILVFDPWSDGGRRPPLWRLHSHDGPYRTRIWAEQKSHGAGVVFRGARSNHTIVGVARRVDESYPFDALIGAQYALRAKRQELDDYQTEELEPALDAAKKAQKKFERLQSECAELTDKVETLMRAKAAETAS